MHQDKTDTARHDVRSAALALTAALAFAAAPALIAADTAPLPPPPELLSGSGYAIDGPAPRPAPVPGNGEFDGSVDPAYGRYGAAANQTRPRNAPAGAGQPQVAAGRPGSFSISQPSRFMPDDYFNLPLIDEAIPGVLIPEFNEDFVDPGFASVRERRRIRPGMSDSQLEPYFDLAKGSERAALEARRAGDDPSYRRQIDRAVAAYMDIISLASAETEAREEAWYGVARCEYRRENWWKAFDALERSFPKAYDKTEVAGRIKLEMFIGERLWRMGSAPVQGARKDGGLLTGYEAASRVYAAAIFNQPGSRDAPLALLRRGDAAAIKEDWEEAAKFYRTVVEYYPESEPAMQARSSLAEAVYRQEWGTEGRTGTLPEAAREDLNRHMRQVETAERKLSPESEERRQRAAALANDEAADTKLRQAKSYMNGVRLKKSRDAAVFLLGDIVSHHPNTPQAREASEILLSLGIEPPMVLTDGSRYPITGGRPATEPGAASAGAVRLDGATPPPRRQNNAPRNYSPAPELTQPVDVQVPGVAPRWEG